MILFCICEQNQDLCQFHKVLTESDLTQVIRQIIIASWKELIDRHLMHVIIGVKSLDLSYYFLMYFDRNNKQINCIFPKSLT